MKARKSAADSPKAGLTPAILRYLGSLCCIGLSLAVVACPVGPADSGQGEASADVALTGRASLGQHPNLATEPQDFTALVEGSELQLVFGLQGLYMAVLAVKTQARFRGLLKVRLTLTSDGTTVADIALKEMRTVRGVDGFDYLWGLRLIVDGDVWRGRPGELSISVVDEFGHRYDERWELVIGQTNQPTPCEDPSPAPTGATDHCQTPPGLVHRLDPGGPLDALDVAAGLGKSTVIVAGRRGNDLLLWESGADVNPAKAHHQAFDNPTPWTDPAGPNSGPWALAVDGVGATLVWGSTDGSFYTVAPGRPLLSLGQGRPIDAFAAPDGYKVMVEAEGVVSIRTFSPADEPLMSHFVVNTSKAGGPLAPTVEDTLIVVTFPGLTETQDMWFQTASIFGGQCSIPTPLSLSLGVGADRRASGLSYGVPLLAVTRPPTTEGCHAQHRVLVSSLSGLGSLDAKSVVSFEHGAQVIGVDDVAGVVGLAPLASGWQLVSQWVDMSAMAPGGVGLGPPVSGEIPAQWAVTRQGRYAMAYSDSGGAWLRRFCFESASP